MTHFLNYTDYAEIIPIWRRIKQSFLHPPHGQLKAQVSHEYFISCIFMIWNINFFDRLTYLAIFLELIILLLFYIVFISPCFSFAILPRNFYISEKSRVRKKFWNFIEENHRKCNKMEKMWRYYYERNIHLKIIISINIICTLSNVALRILRIHSDTMYIRCTHSESKRFINKVTYQWLVQIIALLPLEL